MAAKKKGGLGRGLDYLFGEGLLNEPTSVIENEKPEKPVEIKPSKPSAKPAPKAKTSSESIVYISLNDIKPNSAQPRRTFNEDSIKELADSIKEYGVIQPVLLREIGSGYELVAGERRWRAARLAGLKSIPAIVRDLDERQNAFYALIENMQREDLNPIDEALGIQEIIENYGLTQEEAAKVVGKSRPYVANSLRLIKLPVIIQEMVQSGKLSAGHGRAIAGLSSEALQLEAAEKAVLEGWSVRQIESYSASKTKKRKKPAKSKPKSADAKAAEEELTEALGTRVTINGNEKRGKLEIEYFSKDELDRIIEILLG